MERSKALASKLRDPGQTNIILVRHGNTDLNDKDRIRGWHDIPLNDEGLQQAEALGKELANKNIDLIATSDFQRASKTAEVIQEYAGVPVIPMPELRPWNVGEHTGKESKMVAPVLEHHAANTPEAPLEGGESFNDFKFRFLNGVQGLIQRYPGKNIAIVTHHRGDMLMQAWEKAGFPQDGNIHIGTFLDWERGIEPGAYRELCCPQNQDAGVPAPQQVAQAMRR